MLCLEVSNQIGNQMFSYAAVKTIAGEKGYDFKLLRCSDKTSDLINDCDEQYGRNIDTVFPNIAPDVIDEIPQMDPPYTIYTEKRDRKKNTSIVPGTYNVNDNTVMRGVYLCTKYFEHNIDNVRKWFDFPEEIKADCIGRLEKYREQCGKDKKYVAVHFRVGRDYREHNMVVNQTYWMKAARKCIKQLGDNVVFLLLYDDKNPVVSYFTRHFTCIDARKSLLYDMCLMTMADANIICNSSFSMMGALLNPHTELVISPSTFPVSYGYRPSDMYADEWVKIKATHAAPYYVHRAHLKVKRICKSGLSNFKKAL